MTEATWANSRSPGRRCSIQHEIPCVLDDFRSPFTLTADTLGGFLRYHGTQIEVLLHPNAANRILHTVMIGEMNGYIHTLLVRRPGYDDRTSLLKPDRAYRQWIERR